MTETKTEQTFEVIRTQAEFDERIKSRLAREKEKWEKGTDTADLRARLEAKDEEIAGLKKGHYLDATRRVFAAELDDRGVVDEGRRERVMRHVNLDEVEATADGQPSREHVLRQLDAVSRDLPELLRPRGAGSRGSQKPVLDAEKPLSRDELEKMSPEEVNGAWDRVQRFLAGERG
jgi:hypothetical protein